MKFFHTAITVNNIEESTLFYKEVFNLTVRTQGERPELGVKFIMLEDKNSVVIELFEHLHPIPLQDNLMDFSKVGIKHIAFIVDNIDEIIEKAINQGAKIIWQPKKGITVKRIAFISDPNNIPIELVEL
ncbi:MAG: VOC family protein [Microgenomates group bacterium]|jgi:catechol 2,3-dioxygenase-like lactoylglutathione lyase family enzyme